MWIPYTVYKEERYMHGNIQLTRLTKIISFRSCRYFRYGPEHNEKLNRKTKCMVVFGLDLIYIPSSILCMALEDFSSGW